MAVVTSTRSTCPNNCEFCGNNGCYGELDFMRHWWDQLEKGNVGTEFKGFKTKLAKIPSATNIRLWDAGDCPGNKIQLDRQKCVEIADTLKNRQGKQFGYTHYSMNSYHNRTTTKMMLRRGTIINVSTLMSYVDDVMDKKLPAVVVVPNPTKHTPNGKPIVMCPEQMSRLNKGKQIITCEQCMKCATWPRNYAIGFLPHGTRKNKVTTIARAAIPQRRKIHAATNQETKNH